MRSARLPAIVRAVQQPQSGLIARSCSTAASADFLAVDRPQEIPLSNPAYLVWGANTDVGKTLVCAGIAAAAARSRGQLLYVKPVQTGFPEDSDARLVAAAARTQPELGPHAAELQMSASFSDSFLGTFSPSSSVDCTCKTLFAWKAPVSPHLAAQREGRLVGDAELRSATLRELRGFALRAGGVADALALIESAGGPASPTPSGTLQCEAWRPLHLPGILVADPRLGGISTTICAYETLALRGSPPVALVTLQQASAASSGQDAGLSTNTAAGNAAMLEQHFRGMVPIVELPHCKPAAGQQDAHGVDEALQSWLEVSHHQLVALTGLLRQAHLMRCERLRKLPGQAMASIWWPFTQHAHMAPSKVLCIDARAGENLLVASSTPSSASFPATVSASAAAAAPGASGTEAPGGATALPGQLQLQPHYDACCSWWTQGVSQEFQPRLVAALATAAARYGHVMHPETASEPAVHLARKLLSSAGQGWADRVFYSDDGSTAVEVAIKMALRKFRRDHGDVQGTQLQVVGVAEGYHGDTLGAMDAVSPSAYTGLPHAPWYESRGLFFQPPIVGLIQGLWTVNLPAGMNAGPTEFQLTWASQDEILDTVRDGTALAARYRQHIEAGLDRHVVQAAASRRPVRLAACLIEPLIQGAGGMIQPDPLFQRILVQACRARGMPVIFDEVFAGMWRLGVVSSSQLLGVEPDIAAFAKLLTGGMMPLSATLASDAVFQSFLGPSKLDALLHGHSYAGNPIGCAVALAALSIYEEVQEADAFRVNPDTVPGSHPAAGLTAAVVDPAQHVQARMAPFWDESAVVRLSQLPNVERVVCLGTVLAATIAARDGGGYGSQGTAQIIHRLREAGIFARPLGNVVYIMVTPTSSRTTCAWLLHELTIAVQAAA